MKHKSMPNILKIDQEFLTEILKKQDFLDKKIQKLEEQLILQNAKKLVLPTDVFSTDPLDTYSAIGTLADVKQFQTLLSEISPILSKYRVTALIVTKVVK